MKWLLSALTLLALCAFAHASIPQICNIPPSTWSFVVAVDIPNGTTPSTDGYRQINSATLAVQLTADPRIKQYYLSSGDTIVFNSSMYLPDYCGAVAGNATADYVKFASGQMGAIPSFVITSCPSNTAAALAAFPYSATAATTNRTFTIGGVSESIRLDVPIFSYRTSTAAYSSATNYPSFQRTVFFAQNLCNSIINLLQYYDFYQFAVVTSDDAYATNAQSCFAQAQAAQGLQMWTTPVLRAVPNASDASAYYSAFSSIKAQGFRVIVMMLTVDSTALAAAQLVKLGMTGGNYLYILNENMWQYKTISDQNSYNVFNGALVVVSGSTSTQFSSLYFQQSYVNHNFATAFDQAGISGPYVFDGVMSFAQSLQAMRSDCAYASANSGYLPSTSVLYALMSPTHQINPSATLLDWTKNIVFQGATGTVSYSKPNGNDRAFLNDFTIYNIQSLSAVPVGTIISKNITVNDASQQVLAVSITAQVVFAGGFTTPPKQYRLGLLWSNVTVASTVTDGVNTVNGYNYTDLRVNVPPVVKFAVQTLNSQAAGGMVTGPDGRNSIVILSGHVAYDDCGASLGITGAAVTAINSIMTNVKASPFHTITNPSGNVYSSGFIRPMAVIGPACDDVATDSAFITALTSYGVPFISYGVHTDFASSEKNIPNFLRVSMAANREARVLLSMCQYYSWTRIGILYSADTYGTVTYKAIPTLAPLFGVRISYSNAISPGTMDPTLLIDGLVAATVNVVFIISSDSNTHFYLTPLMRAAVSQNNYFRGVQFIAMQNVATFLMETKYGGTVGRIIPQTNADPTVPILADLGMMFTLPSFDFANTNWLNFVSAWGNYTGNPSPGSPFGTAAPYAAFAYDAVTVVASAIQLSTNVGVSVYSNAAFNNFLRQANIPNGLSGAVAFDTLDGSKNDRQGQSQGFSVNLQTNLTFPGYIQIGYSDSLSNFVLTQNPPVFGGYLFSSNIAVPPIACSRGAIGSYTFYNGTNVACNPCPVGTYGPVGATACVTCTSAQFCPLGASVPFTNDQIWMNAVSSTQPIRDGDNWATDDQVNALYAFHSNLWGAAAALVIGLYLLSRWRPSTFGFINQNMVYLDAFYDDHPAEKNGPIIKQQNLFGGYVTFAYLCFFVLLAVYLVFRFILKQYSVVQNEVVGSTNLINPMLFALTVNFVSIDNFPDCTNLCLSNNQVIGLNGTFTCTLLKPTATCQVDFQMNNATGGFLPPTFSFDLNFANCKAHAVYYYARAANWYATTYGTSNTIEAPTGTVLYGYKTPSVVAMQMQPYSWTAIGSPALLTTRKAPSYSSGYFALPTSQTMGDIATPQQAYFNSTNTLNKAGVRVIFNFTRINSIKTFQMNSASTFIDLFATVSTLAITLLWYGLRSFLMFVEWAMKRHQLNEANKLKSRADKERDEQEQAERDKFAEALENGDEAFTEEKTATVLMKVDIELVRAQNENLRREAGKQFDAAAEFVKFQKLANRGMEPQEDHDHNKQVSEVQKEVERSAAKRGKVFTKTDAQIQAEKEAARYRYDDPDKNYGWDELDEVNLEQLATHEGAEIAKKLRAKRDADKEDDKDQEKEEPSDDVIPWESAIVELMNYDVITPNELITSLLNQAQRDGSACQAIGPALVPELRRMAFEEHPFHNTIEYPALANAASKYM